MEFEEKKKPVVEKKKSIKKANPVEPKRIFKGEQEYFHDLFKLNVAMLKERVSLKGQPLRLLDTEHTHYYHTITSDGKPQTQCAPKGGHTHRMENIGLDAEGHLKFKASPAIKKSKHGGFFADTVDTHTHEVVYVRSEVITPRKINSDFQQYRVKAVEREMEMINKETEVAAESKE